MEEVVLRFWNKESREAFLGQLSDGWGEGFVEFTEVLDPDFTILEIRWFYDPCDYGEKDEHYKDEHWNNPKYKEDTNYLPNIHPGDVILQDFLVPLGMSLEELAERLCLPLYQTMDIVANRYPITPLIAQSLSAFLGGSAEFWLNLQDSYAKEEEERKCTKSIPE